MRLGVDVVRRPRLPLLLLLLLLPHFSLARRIANGASGDIEDWSSLISGRVAPPRRALFKVRSKRKLSIPQSLPPA